MEFDLLRGKTDFYFFEFWFLYRDYFQMCVMSVFVYLHIDVDLK